MSLQDRIKRSGPYILGGSALILEQLSKLADLIPSPFVKPGVEIALSILNIVQVRVIYCVVGTGPHRAHLCYRP